MFDFDDDEDCQEREVYTKLANDELEKWRDEKDQTYSDSVKGGFSRFWHGANTVMNKYAKRRNDLNRETIKSSETLTNMQDFLHGKVESVHMRVKKYLIARKAMRIMNKDLGSEFVTL